MSTGREAELRHSCGRGNDSFRRPPFHKRPSLSMIDARPRRGMMAVSPPRLWAMISFAAGGGSLAGCSSLLAKQKGAHELPVFEEGARAARGVDVCGGGVCHGGGSRGGGE